MVPETTVSPERAPSAFCSECVAIDTKQNNPQMALAVGVVVQIPYSVSTPALGTDTSGSDLTSVSDDNSQSKSDSDANSGSASGGASDSCRHAEVSSRDGEPGDNEEVEIVWAKAS